MKLYIKRPKNNSEILERNDKKFMADSYNQASAEFIVKAKAEDAQNKNWSKQQLLDHLRRRGYLKTEMDRKIVESVLNKKRLREDEKYKPKPKITIINKPNIFTIKGFGNA